MESPCKLNAFVTKIVVKIDSIKKSLINTIHINNRVIKVLNKTIKVSIHIEREDRKFFSPLKNYLPYL